LRLIHKELYNHRYFKYVLGTDVLQW
jgi:hypothetical protein